MVMAMVMAMIMTMTMTMTVAVFVIVVHGGYLSLALLSKFVMWHVAGRPCGKKYTMLVLFFHTSHSGCGMIFSPFI